MATVKTTTISFALSVSLANKLDAERGSLSRSDFLRRLIMLRVDSTSADSMTKRVKEAAEDLISAINEAYPRELKKDRAYSETDLQTISTARQVLRYSVECLRTHGLIGEYSLTTGKVVEVL